MEEQNNNQEQLNETEAVSETVEEVLETVPAVEEIPVEETPAEEVTAQASLARRHVEGLLRRLQAEA